MAIQQYTENGQTLWKVYVHIRSTVNRTRRIQRYASGFTTEAAARREEKKIIQKASRQMQQIDGLGLNWEDIVYLWWEEVKKGDTISISTRTAEGYFSTLKKWTRPWFNIPAAELTRQDGRELIKRLERSGLAKATQVRIKNMVNKIFEWGIEFGFIQTVTMSPMKGLLIRKGEQKAPDILSLEEIKKFLVTAKNLEHKWYPIWAFAILTGMRSGELHALSWNQVDLEKNVILVDRAYDANSRKIGSTKGRYWRTVPINKHLLKLIHDLKRNPEIANSEFVLPRIKDWDNGDQAVPLRNFLRSMNMKPIKFHALRACFATQMLASGVSAPIVMKIGGWKKSSTMDIYLRMAGVDTKGATDCLEFIPDEIDFKDNVVPLFGDKNEA